MDSDVLVTLGLALVCLFVVASAAGSLESAVDSSPSEAIDLDYASLPLDRGDASDIKREYQTLTDGPSQQEHSGQRSSQSDQSSSSGPDDSDSDSASERSNAQRDQSDGPGETPDETNPLERLIDALLALLSRLVELLVALAGVVALAVVVRYRRRLAEHLRPLVARFGSDDSGTGPTAGDDNRAADLPPAPENEVTEAWYEMVERLRLDDRQLLTPRERAAVARENGADANTVWSLTELFEEVRYGGAPVTEDRRRRAREYLERLDSSGGRDQS
ncbi:MULTISPECIES: DUF4129 domain-containing protein [Haloferax]|uniref:Protein-glutamine gamma-glutamyltransferase-like C-terminal domain-containing protein n=1 Tax=Haloferax massiliensis TaxID=1476858 RepID=A0A0D6JVL4_9EURY|nr:MULTISPECIES: DUF4129 domain-containing protein [Haloferax]MDS0242213.1 DUF4129 domain-containing protein [Haloferax sp. S2CR25]MDS0445334.1 DUF4129 domain-containing protein [Haloferax sp. S2CR25-2]CQR52970.1 hypothetical protein BN996_03393 [Haloferax massiliensis]